MSKKKHRVSNVAKVLIAIGIILGLAILYLLIVGNNVGVVLNCDTKSIEGFAKVPPPLMAVYQPPICKVNVMVETNGNVICSNEDFGISTTSREVFECNELKQFEGKYVKVTAVFMDNNQNVIGTDEKTLIYQI